MYKTVIKDLTKRAEKALREHQGYTSAIKFLTEALGASGREAGRGEGKKEQEKTGQTWRNKPRHRHVAYRKYCSWPPCGAQFVAGRIDAIYCPTHRHPHLRTERADERHRAQASTMKPKGVTLLPGDPIRTKEGQGGDKQQR